MTWLKSAGKIRQRCHALSDAGGVLPAARANAQCAGARTEGWAAARRILAGRLGVSLHKRIKTLTGLRASLAVASEKMPAATKARKLDLFISILVDVCIVRQR